MDGITAHKYSFANKTTLEKEAKCGYFYCCRIFSPDEIEDWCENQPDWTDICLYCTIDSVIGESVGYPLTREALKKMHDEWL